MGLVDVLADEIDAKWSVDVRKLLELYEAAYPPDLAIKMGEDPGSFDFDIFGGDLGVAGFYINSTYESLIQLATQDLLIRILTNRNTSRLFPTVGNRNIAEIPKEAISSSISIAIAESAFIDTLNYVEVEEISADELYVAISATSVTGDSLSVGFEIR